MKPHSEATRTPTPWRATYVFDDMTIRQTAESGGDNLVASLPMGNRELAEANAAFIVRAVNAHEELVASVKELFHIVDAQSRGVWNPEERRRAEKAIAKAEGR